jgi:4-amino-4-deoxy-L-arabinose transferase-like glycosyltransferase
LTRPLTPLIHTLNRYHLPWILLLAAGLRLAVLLWLQPTLDFTRTGVVQGSDAYDAYAVNLLATGVYGRESGVADALLPPLYSYALAGVYAIVGRGYWQVGLFHIALDLLSIVCLYHIGRLLFERGRLIGGLAGLLYAGYPYLIFQNLTLIDTPFFMTLLYAFLLLVILLRERERLDREAWLLAILAGVMLGLATLTRAITPPLALLVAVWFLFRLGLWQTVLRLLPVALVSAGLLGLWIARNYQAFNAFIPMSTTSGSNLWQGNSRYVIPFLQAGYDVQWTSPSLEELGIEDSRSLAADQRRTELAVQFWRDNPGLLPELILSKLLAHWSLDVFPRYNPRPGEELGLDADGNFQITRLEADGTHLTYGPDDPVTLYEEPLFDQIGRTVHRLYWGGLFLLGVVGLALTARQWRRASLLWFVHLSMTFMYVLFHPSTRYRAPTDPLWFLFSAAALAALWSWLEQRRAMPAWAVVGRR